MDRYDWEALARRRMLYAGPRQWALMRTSWDNMLSYLFARGQRPR